MWNWGSAAPIQCEVQAQCCSRNVGMMLGFVHCEVGSWRNMNWRLCEADVAWMSRWYLARGLCMIVLGNQIWSSASVRLGWCEVQVLSVRYRECVNVRSKQCENEVGVSKNGAAVHLVWFGVFLRNFILMIINCGMCPFMRIHACLHPQRWNACQTGLRFTTRN